MEVGIYELGGLPPAFSKIKGILAVNYFQNKVLTFDYTHSLILVSEEPVKWEGKKLTDSYKLESLKNGRKEGKK